MYKSIKTFAYITKIITPEKVDNNYLVSSNTYSIFKFFNIIPKMCFSADLFILGPNLG